MQERRSTIGGTLLSIAGLAWVSDVVMVGTAPANGQHFTSPISLGLIVAGALCLIAAVIVFGLDPRLSVRAVSKRSRKLAWQASEYLHFRRPTVPTREEIAGTVGMLAQLVPVGDPHRKVSQEAVLSPQHAEVADQGKEKVRPVSTSSSPARHQVLRDRKVLLTLRTGASLIPNQPVQCDVVCPNGVVVQGQAVPQSPPPWRGAFAALMSQHEATLVFPTEFEGAPDVPPLGAYHVVWTTPASILGLFTGRVVHDAFRLQRDRRSAEPAAGSAAVAVRRSNDNDRSHWRDQILSRGHELVRRCEKTREDTPAFPALVEDVRDYVGNVRGPAIGKFNAQPGSELLEATDEKRLLSQGGAGDLKVVVESYLSLFGEGTSSERDSVSPAEIKQRATDLIAKLARLRKRETSSRSRDERDGPACNGSAAALNILLRRSDDLVSEHFSHEAHRVASEVPSRATSQEVITAIDATLAPLQNLERLGPMP